MVLPLEVVSGWEQLDFHSFQTGIAWVVVNSNLIIQSSPAFVVLVLMGYICYVWASRLQRWSPCQLFFNRCLRLALAGSSSEWKAWRCLSCLKCVSRDSLTEQICAMGVRSNKNTSHGEMAREGERKLKLSKDCCESIPTLCFPSSVTCGDYCSLICQVVQQIKAKNICK